MIEIVKLWAKQAINNALYYRNGPNTTSVHDLPFNFEVFVWRESGNWNGLYCLLAVENETCYVQLLSGPTRFKNMSVKPYFRPENICDVKLNKLETTDKLNELKAPTELDDLKAPPFTLKVLKKLIKPIKPTIKRG